MFTKTLLTPINMYEKLTKKDELLCMMKEFLSHMEEASSEKEVRNPHKNESECLSVFGKNKQRLERGVYISKISGERLITAQKAEELTGFTRAWIHRLAVTGKIRFVKPNKKMLYYENDLINYLS